MDMFIAFFLLGVAVYFLLVRPYIHMLKEIDKSLGRVESKDDWYPGKDLPWELQIMCDQVERFSLEQIVEACEMKIDHPELVVDVSEDDDVGYVAGPIATDRYGFPAVGNTAYCVVCQEHYTGAPHLHSNIQADQDNYGFEDDIHP